MPDRQRIAVARLRYRRRGWNGAAADPLVEIVPYRDWVCPDGEVDVGLAERGVAMVTSTYTNAWGELSDLVDP